MRKADDEVVKPAVRNFIAVFIIAVVGMAIYGMVRDGHTTSTGTSQGANCANVQQSFRSTMPTTTTTTRPPGHTGIQSWAASYDPNGTGSDAYKQGWLTATNLIVGYPQCFEPKVVATAQAALQTYFGH